VNFFVRRAGSVGEKLGGPFDPGERLLLDVRNCPKNQASSSRAPRDFGSLVQIRPRLHTRSGMSFRFTTQLKTSEV
jgi:hypothetical protein